MRVTAQTKIDTRQRILAKAHNLFRKHGFDATHTRQITQASRIAAGTLFNYFPTKESLGVALVGEALSVALKEFDERRRGDEAPAEELFALILKCLNRLVELRGYLPPIVEAALGPFSCESSGHGGDVVRVEHLEKVSDVLRRHGCAEPSVVSMHLYWTLFLGVLSYWATDESPNQENTLALLDQSTRMFAASMGFNSNSTEVVHDAQRA